MLEGTTEQNATALKDGGPRFVRVSKVPPGERMIEERGRDGAEAERDTGEKRAAGQSGVEVTPA